MDIIVWALACASGVPLWGKTTRKRMGSHVVCVGIYGRCWTEAAYLWLISMCHRLHERRQKETLLENPAWSGNAAAEDCLPKDCPKRVEGGRSLSKTARPAAGKGGPWRAYSLRSTDRGGQRSAGPPPLLTSAGRPP